MNGQPPIIPPFLPYPENNGSNNTAHSEQPPKIDHKKIDNFVAKLNKRERVFVLRFLHLCRNDYIIPIDDPNSLRKELVNMYIYDHQSCEHLMANYSKMLINAEEFENLLESDRFSLYTFFTSFQNNFPYFNITSSLMENLLFSLDCYFAPYFPIFNYNTIYEIFCNGTADKVLAVKNFQAFYQNDKLTLEDEKWFLDLKEEDIYWVYTYINKKLGQIPLPFGYNLDSSHQKILDFVLFRLDLLGNTADRIIHLHQLKKAFYQYRYRNKKDNDAVLKVILSRKCLTKLERLSDRKELSQIEVIENLINDEYAKKID